MIHTKRVLILENDASERKTLTEFVEKHKDVQVYATDNIGEAMEISLRNNIDLFFVDIVLDNNSSYEILGMEFAKMIRKISQYAFTPIVFITCLDDPSMSAYRDIHCYSYLGKEHILTCIKKRRVIINEGYISNGYGSF
ncbi:MAG: response regulator [Lachnospiraceae bacterium]|nr:response regulator [Lachnospiraceae bacterium]